MPYSVRTSFIAPDLFVAFGEDSEKPKLLFASLILAVIGKHRSNSNTFAQKSNVASGMYYKQLYNSYPLSATSGNFN